MNGKVSDSTLWEVQTSVEINEKILFYTNIPSPYRVDFFNELGEFCELTVLFESTHSTERDELWKQYHFENFEGIIMSGKRTAVDMAFCLEIIRHLKAKKYDVIVVTIIERGNRCMDSLEIGMPAYNEEANIEKTIESWYKVLEGKSEDSRLVIADSGSTDATHDILISLKKKYPKLDVLENTDKQHGPKVIALYDYAIRKGVDYVFQTDSDGQTNPDEFDMFWTLRKQYDGIFGRRDERGDGKSRAFVERVVCALLRIYFGVKIPDANAPFRLMKTEVVKKYLYRMHRDYNLPNIMMTTYFVYYGEKYKFMPISFKPRQGGVNSINIPKIVGIGWRALSDFKMLKKGMN